jgi:Domain of unknown function (DUF4340)
VRIRQHVATFVFVAAAIGLSVYAYIDRDAVSDPERARRGHNLFPAFRREQVTRVDIGEPGQKPMVLERDPGDGGETSWRMTSPLAAKADLPAVDNLVGVLEYASPVRKLDRDPPGFDPVRRTGSVTMGALVYRFALGGASPSPEGSSYLRLDGEGTFVIARELTADLLKSTDVYRDKTIVPYLSIHLSSLAVYGKDESWSMHRIDETSFQLDDGTRCSRETIDLVWSALAEMRAESFLPDTAALAIDVPEFRIVMTPSDKSSPEGEIVVGGPCPDHPEDVVVVRRAPTPLAACAPRGILRGLATPKSELVDKRLFVTRADEVEELRLETSPTGAGLEIARRGTGWHQRRPVDRDLTPGEAEMATALVLALTKAEGTLHQTQGKAPFTPSARATIVRGGDTRVEEVVEIGDIDGGSLARRKLDGGVLAIGRDVRRLLSARATALAERRVFDPPVEGKPIAGVETHCAGVEQILVRESSSLFQMKKPPGYPADQAGAIDLGDAIARAKAETRVADDDDGSFGFEARCTVAVTVKDGGGTRRVALALGSATADGGVYARAEGSPDVFVLRGPFLERAKTPLVDRNVFFAAPASVQAIRFTRPGGDIVVPRYADGGAHPAIEALGQLTADRVVHLGPAHPEEGFGKPTADVRVGFARDAGIAAKRFLIGGLTKDKTAWYARADGIDASFVISTEKANAIVAAAKGL